MNGPPWKSTKHEIEVTGSTGRPDSVKPLRDFLTSQRPFLDALVLPCEFSLPWWSNRGMSQISTQIGSQIDAFYLRNQKSISKVILCGYSLGAMLAVRHKNQK